MMSARRTLAALLVVVVWPFACDCDPEPVQTLTCDFTMRARTGAEIDFGSVEVNAGSREANVVLENVGNVPLTQLDFSFTGNGDDYAVDVPDGFRVNPGDDENIVVRFVPTRETTLNAELVVTHAQVGAARCPVASLTLRGEGIAPTAEGEGEGAGEGEGEGEGASGEGEGEGSIVPPDDGVVLAPDAEWFAYGGFEDARARFGRVTLDDGTILVVGGWGESGTVLDTIERFDPQTGTSRVVAHMAVPRAEPAVTLMPGGLVVIAGGRSQRTGGVALRTIETFNPVDNAVGCLPAQGTCSLADNGQGLLPVGRIGALATSTATEVIVALGRTFEGAAEEAPIGGADVVTIGGASPPTSVPDAQLPARSGEARVIRADGSFLVVGGRTAGGAVRTGIDRFDASTHAVTTIGDLPSGRAEAGAVTLSNGDVLVVGGVSAGGAVLAAAARVVDAFGPSPAISTVTIASLTPRARPFVVPLPEGLVLVAGGVDADAGLLDDDHSIVPLTSAEVLVPFGASFVRLAPDNELAQGRVDGDAIVVGAQGDEVVFVGGMATSPRLTPHPHAERYAFTTNRFATYGLMGAGTALAPSALASTGAALVALGGIDPHEGRTSAAVRAFDAVNGGFVDVGALVQPRRDHTATLLGSHHHVVIGGRDASGAVVSSLSIFDAATGIDHPLGVALRRPRASHSATVLAAGNPYGDGAIVVCGGLGSGGEAIDSCELFVPPTNLDDVATYGSARIESVGGRLATGRVGHSATLLDSGEVLLVGGGDIERAQVAADLVVPDAAGARVLRAAVPVRARRDHAAVFLGSGRVLLVGGEVADGVVAPSRTVELFSRGGELGSFTAVDDLETARSRPAAVLLANGNVLVSGGTRSLDEVGFPTVSVVDSELYAPGPGGVGTFTRITLPLSYGRSEVQVVNVFGRAIAAGGTHRDGVIGSGSERRTPQLFVDVLEAP